MLDPCPSERAAAPDPAAGLAALIAHIERSAIRAGESAASPDWAPPGYDETDIRILEWIASHRRARHARAPRAELAA
jgi:hypothetical protein